MREAEFRSEVKLVNKSEEGGERVTVESVSLRVCQSLAADRGENTKARYFSRRFSLRPQFEPAADLISS